MSLILAWFNKVPVSVVHSTQMADPASVPDPLNQTKISDLFACLLAWLVVAWSAPGHGCSQSKSTKSGIDRGGTSVKNDNTRQPEQVSMWPTPVAGTKVLKNVWRLSPRIICGSEPSGAEAFEELKSLGVSTIVSVDGAEPNVALARQAGVRYVHIPIAYDGVPEPAAWALVRASKEIVGTIYVHCHHGKHRGPAAAAILCRCEDGRSAADARQILERAGTGAQYSGLWRDVDSFRAPKDHQRLPELVPVAQIDPLSAAMVRIDRTLERLRALAQNDWQSNSTGEEPTAEQQALLLREDFHESIRTGAGKEMDATEVQWMRDAEKLSGTLESQLKMGKSSEAQRTLAEIEKSCQTCHERYRN